jgi:hypothetical protein
VDPRFVAPLFVAPLFELLFELPFAELRLAEPRFDDVEREPVLPAELPREPLRDLLLLREDFVPVAMSWLLVGRVCRVRVQNPGSPA